ncbi:MAG: hypothetical protein AB7T19_17815 [Planctomycetota bacterium]
MGSGTHQDGIWNLTFRIPPSSLVPEEYWHAAIRAASHRLHEVTEGTQAIGCAWLASEFAAIATADVLCIEPGINPNANLRGIGKVGMNVAMSRPDPASDTDFDWWVQALVHELGHYLFGLGDEVHDGNIPDDRCVMADPRLARLCKETDHNRHADNSQNQIHHGQSCQTVVDHVMGHLPRLPPDRADTRIRRITESQRFVFVDTRVSGQTRTQAAGDDGLDRAVAVCRRLAAATGIAIHSLRHHSGGPTAGIEMAAAWILAEPRGSASGIFLVGDAIADTTELRAALRACREHGIRVTALASRHSDPAALAAIADETLGGFEVLPDGSAPDHDRQVAMRLVRGFCGSRNGVGLGAFEQTWLEPTAQIEWEWQVERGVETLEVLVVADPATELRVTLHAPDGSTITSARMIGVPGWNLDSIGEPLPGQWKVSVSAPGSERRVPISAWSAIHNPTFGISIRGFPAVAKSGSVFPLFAYSGFSSPRRPQWELRARSADPHSPTELILLGADDDSARPTVESSRGCEWCPPDRIATGYGGVDETIPADWLGARDFELILKPRGPGGCVATRAIPFQLLVW